MGVFAPEGNYKKSSRDVRSTLYCVAAKQDGNWIPASMDLTHLEEANIANHDGYLVNLRGNAGRKGFLPKGEYLSTSRDCFVILSALCQTSDRGWRWSTLDITQLKYSISLSNVDGVLTVDGNSTN
jgi:hypothetical protein